MKFQKINPALMHKTCSLPPHRTNEPHIRSIGGAEKFWQPVGSNSGHPPGGGGARNRRLPIRDFIFSFYNFLLQRVQPHRASFKITG